MKNILVLCTGNICRSPIGEYLLRNALGAGYTVMSAGLSAVVDSGPDATAAKVALENGLDISLHKARQVNMDMLRWADLILVMEEGQKNELLRKYSWLEGKLFRFGASLQVDIPDPYRRPESAFIMAWKFLSKFTPYWVDQIKQR
jgi:protein-tyrosine phosphatase